MSKYSLFTGKNNQYYFNLKAGNHQIILQSEGYKAKQSAINGIESVRENSLIDAQYERKAADNEETYFVLKAKNGEIIGVSETYSSNQMMEKGLKSVKANGQTSNIDDQTNNNSVNKSINIFVNKEKFRVDEKTMTGTEILALINYTPDKYDLFRKDGTENIPVQKDEVVVLKNGMHFYAILKNIQFG